MPDLLSEFNNLLASDAARQSWMVLGGLLLLALLVGWLGHKLLPVMRGISRFLSAANDIYERRC